LSLAEHSVRFDCLESRIARIEKRFNEKRFNLTDALI
jgi:hypothetical protein